MLRRSKEQTIEFRGLSFVKRPQEDQITSHTAHHTPHFTHSTPHSTYNTSHTTNQTPCTTLHTPHTKHHETNSTPHPTALLSIAVSAAPFLSLAYSNNETCFALPIFVLSLTTLCRFLCVM